MTGWIPIPCKTIVAISAAASDILSVALATLVTPTRDSASSPSLAATITFMFKR